MKPAKRIEVVTDGNTQKIMNNGQLDGTVIRHAANSWEYRNSLGKGGTEKTELLAFLQLGYKPKGRNVPEQADD